MEYSLNDINSSFSFSGIYKWINKLNGKVYIGQSINIYNRFLDYKKGRFNPHMKKSINKYGIDNFSIEILEKDIVEDELNIYEQKWMDYYMSYNPKHGYNIAPIAGNTRGLKKSEEEKHQMSVRSSQRKGDKNGFYGKTHSDETKEKMSKSHKGHSFNPTYEHIKKWRDGYLASIKQVKQIDKKSEKIIQIYKDTYTASAETNSSYTGIRKCCTGKLKTCNGYIWEEV